MRCVYFPELSFAPLPHPRLPRSRAVATPAALAALLLLALPTMASAYVGPGAGLTAIGTVFALVGALFLALVGFVWYPLKRMFRRAPAAETPGREGGVARASARAREPRS